MELQVHHADEALIVLDKPAGLLAVPGRGADKQDCLSARALQRWPDARVVHRLDMATSGLMVLARGAEAQRALNFAFASREIEKRYVAVVAGVPEHAAGSIDLPLAADWPNRPMQKVDHTLGKPAITRWRLLQTDEPRQQTRLELEPVSGRTHQLRVHLWAIGHPIIGDRLYAPQDVQAAAARLLLHASRLSFRHPASGQALVFDSAAPF